MNSIRDEMQKELSDGWIINSMNNMFIFVLSLVFLYLLEVVLKLFCVGLSRRENEFDSGRNAERARRRLNNID